MHTRVVGVGTTLGRRRIAWVLVEALKRYRKPLLTFLLAVVILVVLRAGYREVHYGCRMGGAGQWAIGMAFGDSPLRLEFASKPSVTCQHVNDVWDRHYVSTPFMIKGDSFSKAESRRSFGPEEDPLEHPLPPDSPSFHRVPAKGKWFKFFEVFENALSSTTIDKGVIAVAWTDNPLENHWHYQQVVLEEEFYLAYPFVFHYMGEYFMIPSTRGTNSIRLYRATLFPNRWTFVRTLVEGHPFVNTSPILHEGRWWLFTLLDHNDNPQLIIFYSNTLDLLAEDLVWKPHPSCPCYSGDTKRTKPGGRPLIFDGVIYRFSQDVSTFMPSVAMHQVTQLTTTLFVEREATHVFPMEQHAWISKRIQHIDMHPLSELGEDIIASYASGGKMTPPKWIAAVDGNRYFYNPETTFAIQVATFMLVGVLSIWAIWYPHNYRLARKCIAGISLSLADGLSLFRSWRHATRPSRSALRRIKKLILPFAVIIVALLYLWWAGLSIFGYPLCHSLQCIPTASFDNSGPIIIPSAPIKEGSLHHEACPITVVVALFDIGRGENPNQEQMQSWDNYLSYFATVLSVNSCYIVHVEQDTVDHVLRHRGCTVQSETIIPLNSSLVFSGKAEEERQRARRPQGVSKHLILKDCKYPTDLWVTSLRDLRDSYPNFHMIENILKDPKSRLVRRPDRVEKLVPEYNLLMFLKMKWLQDAALENPFKSSYVFWMDGGYGKGWYFGSQAYHAVRWPNYAKVRQIVDPHRFFMLNVNDGSMFRVCRNAPEAEANDHDVTIAGGFFGGTVGSIQEFAGEFHYALYDLLSHGVMDDDQFVLNYVYCRRPDLVQLHYCIHQFFPFQLISIESKTLSWGRYHCPIAQFATP